MAPEAIVKVEEATSTPIAYMTNDVRLVEVLWIEGDVMTVQDCALDCDTLSTFEIKGAEIAKWRSVDPDG
jgi:hypothetical protein